MKKATTRKALPAGVAKVLQRLKYPLDVILLCVQWYVAYPLSLRNLEKMMAERDFEVDHSSVHRWVIKLEPLFEKAFRRYKLPLGKSWRMDETYIKVRVQWKYLYRAEDKAGNTVDFLLRAHRDKAAARRYFEKAIDRNGAPETVTWIKAAPIWPPFRLSTLNGKRPTRSAKLSIERHRRTGSSGHQTPNHANDELQGFALRSHILSGIETINVIRKGQMEKLGVTRTAAAQFYLLVS